MSDLTHPHETLGPLYDMIVRHTPEPRPTTRAGEPAAILAVLIESDPFLGRLLTGRVDAGMLTPGMTVHALSRDGKEIEQRPDHQAARLPRPQAPADRTGRGRRHRRGGGSFQGDGGRHDLRAGGRPSALPAQPIDPPTISMTVSVNDSPLAGRDGDKVQSRVIRERLLREAEANVAIKVSETDDKDAFEVAGRGELQLGVLIENMRREGFEVSISRPRVVYQTDRVRASGWSRSRRW